MKTGVIFLLTTEIPRTDFRKFSGGGLFLRPAVLFIGYSASAFAVCETIEIRSCRSFFHPRQKRKRRLD